jgi:IclR family acetate operon transcriptional repressor
VTESGEARGTLGTVRNAVLLLDLLTDGPAFQNLTVLAERSGLSIPTVHRLLRSLVLADLVEQDPKTSRYSLGPEVARLSERYLGRLPILGALSPYLVALRDALDATVHVAVLVRESVVYVDRVDGNDGGPYRDSHRVSEALLTPSGRLLAAHASDEVWQRCLSSCPQPLDGEPDALRTQWAQAAYLVADKAGPASTPELAVPVTDASGRLLAALSASVSQGVERAGMEEVAAQLTRAATAAGRTLGNG